MESFVRRNNNVNSFFERISDTTRNNPATNVAQIATNGTMINIRGKKIEFNRRDEIFSLVKPTEEKQNNDYWNLCDKEIKKSSKRKDCEFWGYFYCKSCIFKSRPFAGSSDDAPKGEVCMICDRKFIAKDIQKFYEQQIDDKEIRIKAGEKRIIFNRIAFYLFYFPKEFKNLRILLMKSKLKFRKRLMKTVGFKENLNEKLRIWTQKWKWF